ncbi:MAG TPA: hypothetical protein VHU15_05625 [Stellaceae bacterium]|jgi:hypothetical protein|nr:hypothetical protein [Stellaceae bacterium]
MTITHIPAANFSRAVRQFFGVVSRKVSSAAEHLATRAGEAPSEYYRFPWF